MNRTGGAARDSQGQVTEGILTAFTLLLDHMLQGKPVALSWAQSRPVERPAREQLRPHPAPAKPANGCGNSYTATSGKVLIQNYLIVHFLDA